MTSQTKHVLMLTGAVAAMSFAASAWAQTAAPAANDGGPQLEEVVVTSTRVESNLQRTPVAVTAITSQALQERGVRSLLDINTFTPSLSIGSRSGASTNNGGFSLRGMGVDSTGSSAAVGIYVDEVYFPSGPGNLLGLFDVERVEVLRGPQGTLFGRNTIAGALQYISKRPERRLGGYIDAIGGSFNRADFQAAVNVPVGETLALRLSGGSLTRSGYVTDSFNNNKRGASRTRQARLQARWTPTDRLSVDLKAEILHERTNGRAVVVTAVNPNAQFVGLARLFGETRPLTNAYVSTGKYQFAGYNAPDYFHLDYNEAQGIVSYKLTDNLTFKSITAWSTTRSKGAQDIDQTPLQIIGGGVTGLTVTNLFTEEAQLSGRFLDDRLKATAGVYYYKTESFGQNGGGLKLGFAVQPFGGDAETDVTSKAVYGQATYNLTDKLSASAGLRYSTETNTGYLLVPNAARTKSSFKNTSPHFGLNYQADETTLLYVKASRGFRAGGQTTSANLPGGTLGFGPETAWTYEAGARLELLDRRLRINPTVFFTDWKQIQFNLLIPTPTTVVVATQNAGNAHIKGFELEGQFAVTDRLVLTGAASILDAEYTKVPNLTRAQFPFGYLASLPNPVTGAVLPGSTVILPNLTKDTELQRTPKYKVSLGARYTQPIEGGSKVIVSGDWSYTDTQRSSVTLSDSVKLPSYNVVNARVQWDSANGKYSVAAFATNLTNSYYFIGGVDFAFGYTTGTREYDPARPREFGVQLTARY